MQTSTDNRFFFLDANSGLPDQPYFYGYAFYNERLTVANTLEPIEMPSALDGSYVSIRRGENACFLGCDYAGCGRLFVYFGPNQSGYWAVSNSFVLLTKCLARRGAPMRARPEMLAAWAARGAFLSQITAFKTSVREIELVPRWMDVWISRGIARRGPSKVELVRRAQPITSPAQCYEDALADYLCVWRDRLRGLSQSWRAIQIHLSGGLDSRVCFSFLSHIARASSADPTAKRALHAKSDLSRPEELSIARRVAESAAIPLNRSIDKSGGHRSASDSVDFWEHNRLGQCASAYTISSPHWTPDVVILKGSGGESFRDFYGTRAASLRDFIAQKKRFFDENNYRVFRASVLRSADTAARHSHTQNRKIVHYGDFRSRFHQGCATFENIVITPLSGFWLDNLMKHAPDGYLENGQILYDIMANMDPGLLELPFDEQSKAPSPTNLKRLTHVQIGDWLVPEKQPFTGPESVSSADPQQTINQSTDAADAMFEFCRRLRHYRARVPNDWSPRLNRLEAKIEYPEEHGELQQRQDKNLLHAAYIFGFLRDTID